LQRIFDKKPRKCKYTLIQDVESIIDAYYKSIDLAIKVNKDNTVSIKVSSLCEIENLKLFNKIQNVLSIIEDSFVNNDSKEKIKTKLVNLNNCRIHMEK